MASPYSAGGLPDNTDVAVGSVFIVIFAISGIFLHLRAFHGYGYKFQWSLLCFAFCVVRILAIGCRIALKDHLTSKALACITQILLAAGIAFLYVVNLQMSRRFFGQFHPRHSVRVHYIVTGAAYLIDPLIVIVIIAIIQSYATTDVKLLQIDRKLRIVSSSILTALAFLPIPVVILAIFLPKVAQNRVSTVELGNQAKNNQNPNGVATNDNTPLGLSRSTTGQSTVVAVAGQPQYQIPNGKTEKGQPESAPNSTSTSVVTKYLKSRLTLDAWKVEHGVPETGFGPTPVSRSDMIWNAVAIIFPAILFTIETGIRTAQAYYIPVRGTSPPWFMSKATFWTCIFGLEAIAIIFMGLILLPKRFTHLKAI